jgi:pyridoxamine 5'-phosphate oxidase
MSTPIKLPNNPTAHSNPLADRKPPGVRPRRVVPSFANNLDETLAHAWALLARGVADRHSPFHVPTVATLGLDGRPRLRTVVLRATDVASRRLRFHTDARSEKAGELRLDPRISVHVYDPAAKIQLRLDGIARLHSADPIARVAWLASRAMSACYAQPEAPGAALAQPTLAPAPVLNAVDEDGYPNFTVVYVEVKTLEWLYLEVEGHRRARFTFDGANVNTAWLAP